LSGGVEKSPSRSVLRISLRLLLALALGSLGGWTLWELHSPLPWLLGSMIVCAVASIGGLPVEMPRGARPPMAALVGTMLGASFTIETFANIGEWILPLAALLVFLLVGAAVGYTVLRRVGGYDRPTAFFAGMPGGLLEMTVLGGENGGDERMIALSHGARIFFVVLFLPFLLELALGQDLPRSSGAPISIGDMDLNHGLWFAGTYLAGLTVAHFVAIPARYMFAPLIISAGVHLSGLSDFVLPSVFLAAAQVIIGAVIGCRFVGLARGTLAKAMGLSILTTAALLAITFAFAGAVSLATGLSFANLVLAYSPGGLAEMSLIALALSGQVAFVVVHHMVRVALVVIISPWLFKAIAKRPSGI